MRKRFILAEQTFLKKNLISADQEEAEKQGKQNWMIQKKKKNKTKQNKLYVGQVKLVNHSRL